MPIILYVINIGKDKEINSLNQKIAEVEDKKALISVYSDNLETIKALKQEILGEEHKIEEFTKQIEEFTNLVIKNREKIDELSNN